MSNERRFLYGGLGLALFMAWAFWVLSAGKSRDDYLLSELKPLYPGQIIRPSSPRSVVHFENFSHLEEHQGESWRWSVGNRQRLCAMLQRSEAEREFKVYVHLAPFLVGRQITLSSGRKEASVVCPHRNCLLSVPISPSYNSYDVHCVLISIPESRVFPGDPRPLGYRFIEAMPSA